MNRTKIAALVAGTALAALTVGCSDTANTNTTVASANTANSNVAVVYNNNGNSPGVVATTNANRMRNYNTRADYERDDRTYRDEVKTSGDSIGQSIEDGWIHFKTKTSLATVDDLRDSTINVDVNNGVITLRGSVASQAHVAAADKAAKAIDGQKGVKNQLKVAAVGVGNANMGARSANANRN
ncbi:MAG: BON domain-containing protein [Pyrinomonadaceae bacterium]|nr:BON domain-containing protein [Pyrinomonadaceae bacterium]